MGHRDGALGAAGLDRDNNSGLDWRRPKLARQMERLAILFSHFLGTCPGPGAQMPL